MRHRVIARLAVLLALGAALACADGAPRAPTDATISLEHVVTLGGASDPSSVKEVISVARVGGEYFVAPTASPGQIHVYDSTGDFSRTIGRVGRGPSEFGPDTWIGAQTDSSLILLDRSRLRILEVERHGSVIRVFRYAGPRWQGSVRLRNGTLLVNAPTPSGGVLYEVDSAGSNAIPPMEGEAIISGSSEEWWYRVLGQGHERGSFWAVHPLDNRLTYHAGVGANPSIELVRPGPSYSDQMLAQRQSLWPPSHYVTGVWQPRPGELWSTTWVSSIEPAHVRDFDAQESLPRLVHEAFDTRIEVADPSTGRIVGSLTVDRALAPSATEGILFAVVETLDGNLLVEIWSARLE